MKFLEILPYQMTLLIVLLAVYASADPVRGAL